MHRHSSPFQRPDHDRDAELCARAVAGDAEALSELVSIHQAWLYHTAVRLLLSPVDAEDLTQEVLLRIVTRLAQFDGRSAFRTWAYRIMFNAFLDLKKRPMERAITGFRAYGEDLDRLPMHDGLQGLGVSRPERHVLIEEARVGCMVGMLLCLGREQRVAYVLGEVLGATSEQAAEVLELTPAAFRKRLQRARSDLEAFMQRKCGLINPENPCRCNRKTRAFIEEGWVDPGHLKFTPSRVDEVRRAASTQVERWQDALSAGDWFRTHKVLDGPDFVARLEALVTPDAER